MTRLAILCPGQGGQHAAMFDLVRAHPKGAAFLDACEVLPLSGPSLAARLDDPAQLFANRWAQPLVVAAQLAAWQALADALPAPALVAGYSVGEVAAQAIAGARPVASAVALAAARAQAMDEAVEQAPGGGRPQGLMSVGGLASGDVTVVLARHGLHVAIVTGEDSLIAGGLKADLQGAAAELGALGARTGELPVGLASHTPFMQGARPRLAEMLSQQAMEAPVLPLLAGIDGQVVASAEAARQALLAQLTQPIQWAASMDGCAERGITVALELGPGAALSRMLRERHPHIACRSLADFRSLDGALAWVGRQFD